MQIRSGIKGSVIARCVAIAFMITMINEIWFITQFIRSRYTERYAIIANILMFLAGLIGTLTFFVYCSIKEIAENSPCLKGLLSSVGEKIGQFVGADQDRRSTIQRAVTITRQDTSGDETCVN